MPMASVATSGRPILVTTCFTSGKRRMICSTRVEMAADSSSEMEGSLRVSTRIAPSSRRGMNSVPRRKTDPTATRTTADATESVRRGWFMASSRWAT